MCDSCGALATVRIDSDLESGFFCDACADAMLGHHGLITLRQALRRPRSQTGECPFCHTKEQEALASGLAGCPLCYEAFPEVWKKLGVATAP